MWTTSACRGQRSPLTRKLRKLSTLWPGKLSYSLYLPCECDAHISHTHVHRRTHYTCADTYPHTYSNISPSYPQHTYTPSYLDAVLPSRYGVPKRPLFFLEPLISRIQKWRGKEAQKKEEVRETDSVFTLHYI